MHQSLNRQGLTGARRLFAAAAVAVAPSCAAFGMTATIAAAQTPVQPASPSDAAPQRSTVERKVTGPANQDIRVGVYVNVGSDCSAGPLPVIRLVTSPTRGRVNVKSAKVSARNYKQCLAIEVPAYVAFYKSEAGFRGIDSFVLEIRHAGGRSERQLIKVTIGAPAPSAPAKHQSI